MRYYTNAAIATTLTTGITASSAVIQVADQTGLPVSYPYTLILDIGTASEEIIEVTGGSGVNLQVLRGVDNSVALSHSPNATVTHGVSARDYADSRTHEATAIGVHGLGPSSSVVGTADTQTLTNKTLTSPTINGATWGPTTTFPGGSVTGKVPAATAADSATNIYAGFVISTVVANGGGINPDPGHASGTLTFPTGKFAVSPVATVTLVAGLTADVAITSLSATSVSFRADFATVGMVGQSVRFCVIAMPLT